MDKDSLATWKEPGQIADIKSKCKSIDLNKIIQEHEKINKNKKIVQKKKKIYIPITSRLDLLEISGRALSIWDKRRSGLRHGRRRLIPMRSPGIETHIYEP